MTKVKVKFLQDFRGRETDELFYKVGDVGEVEEIWLERLVQDKRVKVVPVRAPRQAKPKSVPKKRKSGGGAK